MTGQEVFARPRALFAQAEEERDRYREALQSAQAQLLRDLNLAEERDRYKAALEAVLELAEAADLAGMLLYTSEVRQAIRAAYDRPMIDDDATILIPQVVVA